MEDKRWQSLQEIKSKILDEVTVLVSKIDSIEANMVLLEKSPDLWECSHFEWASENIVCNGDIEKSFQLRRCEICGIFKELSYGGEFRRYWTLEERLLDPRFFFGDKSTNGE